MARKRAKLILSAYEWTYPANAEKPAREKRDLPDWKVGNRITESSAAPGIGSITWEVTRIDERGIWGIVVENSIREMTPAEAR